MITKLTTEEFEKDLTRRAIKGVRHAAIVLNECHGLFWNRPPEEILASINSKVAATIELFTANSAMGAAINEQLSKSDVEERVITSMPAGYSFNGTQFVYTAPVPVVEEEIPAELPPQQMPDA